MELVYTRRRTPAARAAASTLRVPSTLTRRIMALPPGMIEMMPAR